MIVKIWLIRKISSFFKVKTMGYDPLLEGSNKVFKILDDHKNKHKTTVIYSQNNNFSKKLKEDQRKTDDFKTISL